MEKWFCRIYLQGSNGETDIENRLMDMGKGEERVRCMERVTCKFILPYVKYIASGNLLYNTGSLTWCSVKTKRGGKEVQEGVDIRIPMPDSCCCGAESITTL